MFVNFLIIELAEINHKKKFIKKNQNLIYVSYRLLTAEVRLLVTDKHIILQKT